MMHIIPSSATRAHKPWWQRRFTTDIILSLLAGLSFGTAFIPLMNAGNLLAQSNHLAWQALLALLGLSLWLCVLPRHNGKRTALLTGLFGLSSYAIGTSWVYISIHTYGQTAMPLAIGLTALFVMALAFILSLPWFFYPKLAGTSSCSSWLGALRAAFSVALCWVVAELLLTYIGTGFPWLLPGYVVQLGVLRQGWLPLIGVHGWDFLLLWNLSLCVNIVMHFSRKQPTHTAKACYWPVYPITLMSLIVLIGVGAVMAKKQWTQALSTTTQLRLVQGAIPQKMKWDSSYLLGILDSYDRLSRNTTPGSIIIWPEGAIPAVTTEVQPFIDYLHKVSKEQDVSFVVGIPLIQKNQFYNGALAIDKDNEESYRKRHLVPFGEYLPLEKALRGIINFFDLPMSDFSAGDKQQKNLNIRGVDIGTLICYEVAYPGLVGQSAANSNMLLAISDDTWFGRSAAAWQQLQISRVRSAETQLPMVLVGNDGYTGWIDAHGHVRKLLPRYQEGTLALTIIPRKGKTPITRFYKGYGS